MAQPTYTERALVLRRTKLGESDLILTMLAEDGSLSRAVAKGARRPKSSFAARTEPLSVADLLCARGRSLDIVKEARLVAAHDALRRSVEASAAAMPLLELAGRMAQPSLANPRLFQVATRALEAMDGAEDGARVALCGACLLKMLAFCGLRPSLDVCIGCGAAVSLTTGASLPFSALEGGVACAACRSRLEVEPVAGDTLRWAAYFLGSTFNDISVGPTDLSASFAVLHLVQSLVRAHVGSPLKSLEFLFTSGLF